jgi:hypothetical protein
MGNLIVPPQLPPIAIRNIRAQTAVGLHEGDRVPFMPSHNNFYAYHYGITTKEAMTNIMSLKDPLIKYLRDYDPDLFYDLCFFPIDALERIGHNAARWPGEHFNLPDNTPYQYVDHEYINDDDYDTYLKDPTLFILTKVLPKKYKALEPFAMLNPYALCGHAIYGFAGVGIPPVAQALRSMAETGELVMKNLADVMKLTFMVIEMGYPTFGSAVMLAPFDDFADNLRGLIQACMDITTDPERLGEAVARMGDVTIPAGIASAKMQHAQYVFIPLHCGMDNFMSVKNYNKHYWPSVKRLINAVIAAEMTPIVFCEGQYDTRLETLTDVEKGKVIYCFEKVDFARAKKILGNYACIGGGMPTSLLMQGNVAQIEDETKRIIDICAPGGGYIMSNSTALDVVPPESMRAWHEATLKFGQY